VVPQDRGEATELKKIDRSHESVCQNNEIIPICLSRPTTKWVRTPADADFACYPMTPRFKHDQRVSRLRNYLKRFAPLTPKKQLCQICAIKKPQKETKSRNQIQTKTNKHKNADQKLFSTFPTGYFFFGTLFPFLSAPIFSILQFTICNLQIPMIVFSRSTVDLHPTLLLHFANFRSSAEVYFPYFPAVGQPDQKVVRRVYRTINFFR
jgi:hypothetical protein